MIGKYGTAFLPSELTTAWRSARGGSDELNKRLRQLYNVRNAVLFSSGSKALECLLRALGRGVALMPAYTCIAVPEAVCRAGWQVRFADLAPNDVNMTPETLERCLSDDVRAVILTHQFGIPPEVDGIVEMCRRRGLLLIDDAAAASGARYKGRLAGTFGDAGILSFGLTKVMPVGRCGALLLHDGMLAQRVHALQTSPSGLTGSLCDYLRAWTWRLAMQPSVYGVHRRLREVIAPMPLYQRIAPKSTSGCQGFRPCSAFAASLTINQLVRLPDNLRSRRRLARLYTDELGGCNVMETCRVPSAAEPAWLQFPVFVENKGRCYQYALQHAVDLSWTFRYSCGESYDVPTVPYADSAARHVLGLPTYPELTDQDARRICSLLRTSVTNNER